MSSSPEREPNHPDPTEHDPGRSPGDRTADQRGSDPSDATSEAGQPRQEPRQHAGELLARLTRHDADRGRREHLSLLTSLTRTVGASARAAGTGAVVSGRWLADLLLDAAPRLPLRDATTLRAHHPGRTDEEIAEDLTAAAARATAAVGALGGAVASAEFLLVSRRMVFSVPAQLAAETLAVAAIEVKLIAELQELYGVSVPGSPTERAAAYLQAWTSRRGLDVLEPGTFSSVLGEATKRHLQRRLLGRAGINVSTLGPYLSGAVAGGAVNFRETRKLAARVRRDLRRITAAD